MAATNDFPRLPGYALHRDQVAAADAALPEQIVRGVDPGPVENAILYVVVDSGTLTELSLRVVYWSPPAGKFVPEVVPETFLVTEECSIAVAVKGRRFFVEAVSVTGSSPVVSIYVSNPNID